MRFERLSQDDESALDEIFDLALACRATGEEVDLELLLRDRPHLLEQARRAVALAREVAIVEQPRLPRRDQPVIAGFTILEEIGRGGMGIVYRARQESLGRVVALKVLAPALLASTSARERFVVEARALARLRHHNLVTVHEVVVRNDLCAYAMEWVEGSTLAKAIAARDPCRDVPSVARLGAELARALAAVHDAGLVHRDVKPSNVLLRLDGTPLLADFSLVHDTEHSLHTMTGEFLGTAAYAAPEQLRGDHDHVGARSDVYSLGVTLYVALTGQTPFGATTTAETLRRIERGRSMPIAKLNPHVPRDLATIVDKAMDQDPDRRYASAADLADDLERFLRFEPIRAKGIGLGLRLRRFAQRRPALATGLGMGVALLAGGPTALYLLEREARMRESSLRTEADKARAAAQTELEIQRETAGFLTTVFKYGDAADGRGRADMTVKEALDRASRELLEGKQRYRPEVEAALRIVAADTYLSIGLVEPAERHLRAALELRRQVHGEESQEWAATAYYYGRALRDLGRHVESEHYLRETIRVRRALPRANDLYIAQALQGLGITLTRQGRLAEAEEAYMQSLAIYQATLGDTDESTGLVLISITKLQLQQGRSAEAAASSRKALDAEQTYHKGPHLDVAQAMGAYGEALAATGQREEGERLLRQALEMARSLGGTPHRRSAALAGTLATHLRRRGELAEAEQLLRESIAANATLHLDARGEEAELVDLLLQAGRAEEAEALAARVLASSPEASGKQHWLRRAGIARTRLARFQEAEANLQQAWAALQDRALDLQERRATADALAALYEAWNAVDSAAHRSEHAEQWRQKRDAIAATSGMHR